MRRPWPVLRVAALVSIPLLGLTACVGDPAPAATPITAAQACAALGDAVAEYYEVAAPGSTVEELATHDLPSVAGFRIPKPTCAFQVRPDPDVVPGDVFTIESFYLDYAEEMTVTLPQRLEASGFTRKDKNIMTWAATKLGRSYSAAMLLFTPEDGAPYSQAAEHFRVLDLSVGQN